MKIKNCFKIIALMVVSVQMLGSSGCTKFVEVAPPSTEAVSATVFTSDQSATSAVVGMYSQIMSSNLYFLNGAMSIYGGLSADEISPNSTYPPELSTFYTNAVPSTSRVIQNDIWKTAYSLIYQENACEDGLQKSTQISAGVQQQLLGEVKFMRALSYFYLTNLFGSVPLVLSTDYGNTQSLPRTDSVVIYQQMLNDLHNAAAMLSENYPGSASTRPNRYAALALLARIYLYQKNWAGADSAAAVIINSNSYSLVSDLNSVFLAGSPEAIFQLAPVQSFFYTAEGNAFVPPNSFFNPNFSITGSLLNSFESGDNRRIAWVDSAISGTVTYYFPYKYKYPYSYFSPTAEYNMLFRLAEQYLIRAEALAETNNPADAASNLDIVRVRAGLPPVVYSNTTDLLTAIFHERQIELFTEVGHRWLDLKRTGQVNEVLGAEKPNWKPSAALYPIPLSEIQKNSNLSQNPGY